MGPYRSLFVFKDSNVSLWVLINLYTSFWVFMGSFVSFCVQMGVMGSVGPHRFFCVPMDSNGSLCFYGSLSVFMSPLGSLWVFIGHCLSI